jgi:hypothetical protein
MLLGEPILLEPTPLILRNGPLPQFMLVFHATL